MGVVLHVVHEETGAEYAMKLVAAEVVGDADARARFEREMQSMAKVDDHPGIVRIYTGGTTPDGRQYYLMDLVQGRSLKQALSAGKRLDAAHRHLRGTTDLVFSDAGPLEAADGADVVFLALTHRESQQAVMALRPRLEDPKGPVVIDMSGAFRILDPRQYAQAYAEEHHAPDLLGTFVPASPLSSAGSSTRRTKREPA